MKRFFITLALISYGATGFTQSITAQLGVGISKLNWSTLQAYDKNVVMPVVKLGYNHRISGPFSLGLNLGMFQRGGKDEVVFTDANGVPLYSKTQTATLTYGTVELEAKVDLSKKRIIPYLAIAPHADFLFSANKNLSKDQFKSTVFGFNPSTQSSLYTTEGTAGNTVLPKVGLTFSNLSSVLIPNICFSI